jgi:hypothetical protein
MNLEARSRDMICPLSGLWALWDIYNLQCKWARPVVGHDDHDHGADGVTHVLETAKHASSKTPIQVDAGLRTYKSSDTLRTRHAQVIR